MKKALHLVTLSLLMLLSKTSYSYNELTFCHEVRNVRLSITSTGTSPAVAWKWSYPGATPVTNGFREDSICGGLEYKVAGTYWVYVETTFANGETDLDTWKMNAFVSVIPNFSLPDSVVCRPSINLNYTTGINGSIYRYLWKPNDQTTANANINSPGSYTGIVYSVDDYSDRFGACDSQWSDFTITQEAPISVDLPQNLFICQGAPVTLDAGNPGSSYAWLPNGESTRTVQAGFPGTYSVIVTTPLGCKAQGQTTVKDSCPIYVWMPNVFSPNGDGKNDSLRWDGNVYSTKDYRFRVYSRWGEKLFDTKDMWQSWDGYYNGKPVQTGVYVYRIEFIDSKEEIRRLEGDVTVLR